MKKEKKIEEPYNEGTAKPNEKIFKGVSGIWADRTDIKDRKKFRRSLWRKMQAVRRAD